MGFIPTEIITQVLDRNDIVETISGYIPLKLAGRNFKAPCPFHHEKTPSFVVNPEKQIFHCFGCGVGGNLITFVMKQERMEFPEAVRFLAQRAGIEIPQANQHQDNAANLLRQQIQQINQLAVKFFHQVLLSDKGEDVKRARDYLKGRGISLEMVQRFQLGFAPDKWDGLVNYLKPENLSFSLLEKAGLVVPQTKGGGYYDRFRNRVIFPIFDVRGTCVAFGARSLDKDNPAKYINSPETAVYTKGRHLYGLSLAKESVGREDSAIVVEGYMDFITPFAGGVANIVASLGTALTTDQVRLLRRFTRNVIMLFDADQAGEAAMARSLDLLVEEGMNVSVAALAEGEDPDSFVRIYGVEAFQQRVAQAQTLFDFKLKFLMARHRAGTAEGNAEIAAGMLTTIQKFENAVIRSEYLKRLSLALRVSEDALREELSKKTKSSGENRLAPAVPPVNLQPAEIRPVERTLLRLMLEEKKFIGLAQKDLDLADFQNRQVRDIVGKIIELSTEGRDANLSVLMSCFDDEDILRVISGLMAVEDGIPADKSRVYRDCTERLKQERARCLRQEILKAMETAKRSGDQERLDELTIEFNHLIKMKGSFNEP